MSKCKCGIDLSRSNKGGLCKTCYHNRKKNAEDNSTNTADILDESSPFVSQVLNSAVMNDDEYDKAVEDLGIIF